MIILCVDTSNKNLSFTAAEAFGRERRNVAFCTIDVAGKMNENFFPSLENFLSNSNLTIYDIDRWVVITGPGSFTGVRIGVAALAGLTAGLGKELCGISALDARAVVSGLPKVTAAARLKLNEYACKDYDFINNKFSAIYIKKLADTAGCVFADDSGIFLTDCICSSVAEIFYGEAIPEYVRKSEAEIIFDKKSTKI